MKLGLFFLFAVCLVYVAKGIEVKRLSRKVKDTM